MTGIRTAAAAATAVTTATALAADVAPLGAQVTVAVSAPATLGPGEPALVRVEVTAPASASVRLAPPDVAPFGIASATRLADRGPRAGWQRQEWRYVLTAPAGTRGRFAFEPFTAQVQGAGLRPTQAESRPWALEVRAAGASAAVAAGGGPAPPLGAASPGVPPRVAAPAAAPRSGVSFTARVTPGSVYVGQQATYELTVAVSAEARARIRRNPEFVPPELRGVLAYDLPASHRGGADGDVHVYRRALFPLAPGVIRVPAARLSYSLAAGASYFSPEERLTLSSGASRVTAVAPPQAGRPPSWDGAVGSLRATARVNTAAVRAGDVVEYTVELDGTGNLALLPRPRLEVPWADVVTADDRAAIDSGAVVVRGRRTFTWLLTPRSPGRFSTPPLAYPYFDPAARAYAVATAESRPVEVGGGATTRATRDVGTRGPERLPIAGVWRGTAGRPLALRPAFWVALGLVPLPAALVGLAVGAREAHRRRRAAQGRRAAGRGGAPVPAGAVALRLDLDHALASRLGFGVSAFPTPGGLVAALRRVGVTAETAGRTARLAAALDRAAYDGRPAGASGPDAPALAELRREFDVVRRDVDREARPRAELAAARGGLDAIGRGLVLALALGAAAASAGCAGSAGEMSRAAERRYAEGVVAYRAGDLPAARAAFAAAAAAAPRAPDAWSAAGAAAWAAGDTVAAAVGWQRALRLNPRDEDVRARLALLPAVQDGVVARVLPVPPNALSATALALATASALLALPAARRRIRRPAWAFAWGASLAVGGASAAIAHQSRPEALAVVRSPGALRTEPALDAEPGRPVDVTDVARVVERSGAWARVRLDGDREGWIAADQLVPLASRADSAAGTADPAR